MIMNDDYTRYMPPYGPPEPPQKKSRHVFRWVAFSVFGLIVFAVVIALIAGGGTPSTPVAQTVTSSAPASQPPATPLPATPTPQATRAAPEPRTVTKQYSGTGNYTSAPIHFGCNAADGPITVKYAYWGNTNGAGADNFYASLDDAQTVPVGDGIANDIAVSGGKTTHLYPSVFSTPPFHLTVEAATAAHWSFTFTCKG